jgi:hypothetical protein
MGTSLGEDEEPRKTEDRRQNGHKKRVPAQRGEKAQKKTEEKLTTEAQRAQRKKTSTERNRGREKSRQLGSFSVLVFSLCSLCLCG